MIYNAKEHILKVQDIQMNYITEYMIFLKHKYFPLIV